MTVFLEQPQAKPVSLLNIVLKTFIDILGLTKIVIALCKICLIEC